MLVGTWLVLWKRFSGKRKREAPIQFTPAISILKPLKGLESGLKRNLETFFNIDYPDYELIFCIDSPSDKARQVVEALLKQYPNVKARLNISQVHIGENPKVNNLYLSYKSAKYDWILISDSNIRVPKHYLKTVTREYRGGVGIVTASIAGTGASGLGGNLEAIYLNSYLTRWMYLAQALGNPLVMGKSMFFQRSVLETMGGLEALSSQIAEDYASSKLMKRASKKIRLMKAPVQQYLGGFSFEHFWKRHIRWGRIRRSYSPVAFALEPLSSALVSGIFGWGAATTLFNIESTTFLAVHFGLWYMHDLFLLLLNRGTFRLTYLSSWFLLEALALPLWVHTLSGTTVNWRGNILQLGKDGHVFQLNRDESEKDRKVG